MCMRMVEGLGTVGVCIKKGSVEWIIGYGHGETVWLTKHPPNSTASDPSSIIPDCARFATSCLCVQLDAMLPVSSGRA